MGPFDQSKETSLFHSLSAESKENAAAASQILHTEYCSMTADQRAATLKSFPAETDSGYVANSYRANELTNGANMPVAWELVHSYSYHGGGGSSGSSNSVLVELDCSHEKK